MEVKSNAPGVFANSNTSNDIALLQPLPIAQRHAPIRFDNGDGKVGAVAYAINYDELYTLKGRLLTLIDATFSDPEQRKAQKDMVWQTVREWMRDIETRSSYPTEPVPAALTTDERIAA